MYAAFLEEAADLLGKPRLAEIAGLYRQSAARWSALGAAALPDSVPALRETRELMLRKNCLFEQQPEGALAAMHGINARLDALLQQASADFPLDGAGVRGLLADLRAAILRVHEVEKEAIRALAGA